MFIAIPIVIHRISKTKAARSSLRMDENSFVGSNGPLGKTKFSIPFDPSVRVEARQTFIDYFRSGKTVVIITKDDEFKIRFVQNADEFAAEANAAVSRYTSARNDP